MQHMSNETLGEREPQVSRIAGKGTCCNCGGDKFEVVIYNDSSSEIVCSRKDCWTIWSPLGQGQGPIARLSKAVVSVGNVEGNMV